MIRYKTIFIYTVELNILCTICFLWNKTTLTTGRVDGAVVNFPPRKTDTFF